MSVQAARPCFPLPERDRGPDEEKAMSYGHAERTLATIRRLEQETRDFLSSQQHLTAEQEQWLREAADSAFRRLNAAGAARRGTTARSA